MVGGPYEDLRETEIKPPFNINFKKMNVAVSAML